MSNREHNRIIKAITIVAVVIGLLSIQCLDSASWIPAIVSIICGAWLILFAVANTTDHKNKQEDIWDETNDKSNRNDKLPRISA